MMTLRQLAIAVALPLLLGACSNGKFTYGKALGDLANITGVTTGLEEVDESAAEVAVTAADAKPPLIVGFKDIRVAIPFAGASGPSQTYASPDGVVLAMNSGFITRATGLGIDMNGSYLPADSAWYRGLMAAAGAGSTSDRVIEYWQAGRVKRDKFRCSLSSTAREGGGVIIDEACKRYFEPITFTNRYWLRTDDTIECSRQWINPKLDPLQFFATEQQALTLDLTKNGC